jgi:rhodanese-related sulfurtransferase
MGLKSIAPSDLHQLIQQRGVTVIDVNSSSSWRSARVSGSLNLEPATFREGDLPTDRDTVLVFYCSNPFCRKAPNAARRAKGMGYRNVRVMSAGISGWLAAELPTESDE